MLGEPDRNWVENLSKSLEKILNVMRNWFTPEEVGVVPAVT